MCIAFLVTNSLQIPFTPAAFSVPQSRWHLRPSCPLILSLPFFLAFHFWSLWLTSALNADCADSKLFSSPQTILFLWVLAGDRYSYCHDFEREGQERRTCHLERGKILKVEYKICICCDIFLVILVLR